MLDPVTALGLACNVFQIISFVDEVYDVSKRIAEDGNPDSVRTMDLNDGIFKFLVQFGVPLGVVSARIFSY